MPGKLGDQLIVPTWHVHDPVVHLNTVSFLRELRRSDSIVCTGADHSTTCDSARRRAALLQSILITGLERHRRPIV
jgi:hypothetical protein